MAGAVILLSGGIDSVAALYKAREESGHCAAVFVDYGQTHCVHERACAVFQANEVGCALYHVEVRGWGGAAPLLGHGAIPQHRSPEQRREGIAPTFLPGRNLMLLSLANALAERCKMDSLWIGATKDDASGYPDCRPEFFAACRAAFGREVVAPWVRVSKREVVAFARAHGIDLGTTRSCYTADEFPCNECDACLLRAEAFQ